MTKCMYFTANKIVKKGDDIHKSARKIRDMLSQLPYWFKVELAESPGGVITAEVKADEWFNPLEVQKILFPKRHVGQIPMYS